MPRTTDPTEEKGVFVPNNLSTKDAVFLYHLKYDAYTKTVVKDITTKIIFSKGQERPHYRIPCWHDKPIMLSFYGIELGNSVLCCQITGISQPQGEPINLYYHSAIKTNGCVLYSVDRRTWLPCIQSWKSISSSSPK